MITVAPHALLDASAFISTFEAPLEQCAPPAWLVAMLASDDAEAMRDVPLRATDDVRAAVRDLLRLGGYKPTGRGKPASEYLRNAVAGKTLGSINAAVDACNVASLHSGLPISVVDLDRAQPPFSIVVASDKTEYVFNASGQSIDVAGLLCLADATGPCANPVKDSQRTKTHGATQRTLSIIWGTRALAGRTEQCARFYRSLLERLGARTENVALTSE